MTALQAVALLSGGLDSMVAAALAREAGFRLLALTVDYGQRHRIELEAAAAIAAALGAERHVVLPLDLSRFGGSALTADIDVPKSGVGNDIPVTYVPARNTIFLSLAWAGRRRPARATSTSASTRSIIPAIPIAARNSSTPSSGSPGSPPRPGVEGERFPSTRRCSHMTKADIVREAARLGLDAGAQLVLLRSGAGRPALRPVRQLPAARQGIRGGRPRRSDALRGAAMSYAVKEIFLTLQGEGMQAGRRAVFLRFAGCNLWSGREAGPRRRAVQLLRHRFRRHRRRGWRPLRGRRRWPAGRGAVGRRRSGRWSWSPAASRCCSSTRR